MEDKTEKSQNYNWDDIEVGNNHLDHSENFFAQKHIKQEKYLADLRNQKIDSETNSYSENNNNKENYSPNDDENSRQMNKATNADGLEIIKPNEIKQEIELDSEIPKTTNEMSPSDSTPDVNEMPAPRPKKPGLVCEWSIRKETVESAVRPLCQPPNAYAFKDHYQRRREEAMRKRAEEEQKMRVFHSRAMPDFVRMQKNAKPVGHAITIPVTPMVLKNSREMENRKRQKLEKLKRELQLPKFEALPPTVLKEPPFVPKRPPTPILQPKPFALQSEKRAQERKQFDSAIQRRIEEKKIAEEKEKQERKKREEEQIKEMRKKTTFKARANPFNKCPKSA